MKERTEILGEEDRKPPCFRRYRLGDFYDSCPRLFDRKIKRVVLSFSIGKLNRV